MSSNTYIPFPIAFFRYNYNDRSRTSSMVKKIRVTGTQFLGCPVWSRKKKTKNGGTSTWAMQFSHCQITFVRSGVKWQNALKWKWKWKWIAWYYSAHAVTTNPIHKWKGLGLGVVYWVVHNRWGVDGRWVIHNRWHMMSYKLGAWKLACMLPIRGPGLLCKFCCSQMTLH